MARQARPALSRERILEAALALVDEDGLESLTMRKLGTALGVEAMSLYHYVPNKAALLDGIHEIILSTMPPHVDGPWPAVVEERARSLRRVLAAHPRAIPLFATRPAVTPESLQHLEIALDVLRRAGMTPAQALTVFQVTLAYVLGHAMLSFAPAAGGEVPAIDYGRLDPQKLPRVVEAAGALDSQDPEQEFELGLQLLIQGIEAMGLAQP